MALTPKQQMLVDFTMKLHEAGMIILDDLNTADPEARDRPLQMYAMKALKALYGIQFGGDRLLYGIKLEDDGIRWRRDAVVLDITEQRIYVQDTDGEVWLFASNDGDRSYSNALGVCPMVTYLGGTLLPGGNGQVIAFEDGTYVFAPNTSQPATPEDAPSKTSEEPGS